MANFNEGWYLLYTRSRHEKSVAESLTEVNVTCFLPMMKRLRNWSDRKKYVNMPVFPSYLFVYLKDLTDYYHCLNAEGVWYFIKFDKKIVRVQDSVIENIRLLTDADTDIEVSTAFYQPGEHLHIYDGPLTGLDCEVVRVNGKAKILVRVSLLQRNLLATLPVESVKPVIQPTTRCQDCNCVKKCSHAFGN